MLRGFLSGGAWGVLVAALGVTTASLLAPQPAGNAPPAEPQVQMPQVAGGDLAGDAPAPAVGPIDPASIAAGPQPQAVTPTAEWDAVIADTTPGLPPVVATPGDGLAAPAGSNGALPVPSAETPVLPNPQAAAPETPLAEADLVLSTAPATPPEPPVEAFVAADLPAVAGPIAIIPVEPLPGPIPEVVPDPTVQTLPETAPEPVPDTAPEPAPESVQVPVLPADPPAAPDEAPSPAPLPGPEPAPGPDPAPGPGAQPPDPPEVAAIIPPADTTAATPPPARIVMEGDAASLPHISGGVQVNRPGDETAPDVSSDPPPDQPTDGGIADGPALTRFAAGFSNPDNKPLLSVILIDDGAIAGMVAALAGVPFAVTVAIDPAGPDAALRMAGYRAAGIEVLAIAKLPDGAQPSDVEVALESVFATLPQAVGLLDLAEGSLQSSAAVTQQAVARLAADGRGLVMASGGLNPALRVAETAQVPVGEVYRDLDGAGQDARTIRRFLDNAAFQARQQSGIILLARLRPETISALILWGTENRAGQVALAPISATLVQ